MRPKTEVCSGLGQSPSASALNFLVLSEPSQTEDTAEISWAGVKLSCAFTMTCSDCTAEYDIERRGVCLISLLPFPVRPSLIRC